MGSKTQPFARATANLSFFNTDIKDFQAQVVNADVGVLRGYLASAEKVRVRGIELDGNVKVNDELTFYGAAALNDGRYISFPDAPPPLEETGGPQVKDISGSLIAGNFEVGAVVRRRVRDPSEFPKSDWEVLHFVGWQLPLCVFVQPERLALSRGWRVPVGEFENRVQVE